MARKQKPRERHCRKRGENGCNGEFCSCACVICSSNVKPCVPKLAMEWAYAAVLLNGRIAAIDTEAAGLMAFKKRFKAEYAILNKRGCRFAKVLITEKMSESIRNRLGKPVYR